MKPSIFNFTYTRDDGTVVVYNTFSKAVIEFDNDEMRNKIFKDATSECCDSLQSSFTSALSENGLIIPNEFDELSVLKYFHYKAKFSRDQLILTIAPTMQCNFACPYCYEKPRPGRMSSEVQDAIVNYINKQIENGVRDIDLTWYGGEPLLCPDIIDSISSRIINLADKHNVRIGFTMVTNGSLLTKEIVEMLVRNRIHSIQITIDGMAENHNKRRPFKGGMGSFDTVLRNLELFRNTPVQINVRMNVDRQNMGDYPMLRKTIESLRNEVDIGLYPALVEHLNADDIRDNIYLSGEEYSSFISNCYSTDLLEDEDSMTTITNRRYFCTSELENCFVIDESGNFYKCWDEIGKSDYICFNVMDPNHINYQTISRYLSDDPFDSSSKCSSCLFLPLCFGGCRYQKHYFGESKCGFDDKSMIEYIEKKYFNQ